MYNTFGSGAMDPNTMLSTDTSVVTKASQDEPPSYNLIAPYAPPDTCPPPAPLSSDIGGRVLGGLSPGMEHLLQVNQLTVREKFRVSQGRGFFFDVFNHIGQRLFQADQSAVCCGPFYDVSIKDNSGNEVVHLLEPCRCTCTREMEVQCPMGTPVGFVRLHWNRLITHLSVMNSSKEVIFLILGPSFQDSIFGNSTYENYLIKAARRDLQAQARRN
ncbi:phospholipid scramblase 2-like isoform X2 [Dendropsophus ebraccatus]|uniref:phospholipid scramblase 2-like isoform X2 n=1 Tax=Dendropsophus ebraccatus TaxID=150705 RepID=UPI0038310B0C